MSNLPSDSWSTSQLVEFLAALAEQSDESHARQVAVERVLESLDAEVGLLLDGDVVVTEVAMLYLADQGILLMASISTVADKYRPPAWRVRLQTSIGRAAYTSGELVRTDNYPESPYAHPELVGRGAQAAMAAPVRENGV